MVLFRLHILALPHTITLPKYSHCAFTSKVLRFAPMMRSRGYEVYHYGIETSEAGADKHIDLLSLAEWNNLRIKSYVELHPKCSEQQAEQILLTESSFVGDLGNSSTTLYKVFNERLRIILPLHYRSPSTDLVCLPFGDVHNAGLSGLNVVAVESGIGYYNSFANYRIFESSALMHKTLEQEKKTQGQHYWFVIPMGFDITDFSISISKSESESESKRKRPRVGYLGRICEDKGCRIVLELAKRMPHIDFIICGQGNPGPFLDKTVANFFYEPPVSGAENRLNFYHSLTAFISPTMYLEPFGAAVVEAQLCGLPVLTPDFGAFLETVEQGRSGYRCHTLADYVYGVTQASQGYFDPIYIRERAKAKYDMYNVAREYDMAFRNILNIHNGANGWYGLESFLSLL